MREMKELKRTHRPFLIILIEPKISGVEVDDVGRKLGKMHWSRLEAEDFSGGVWLLWDNEEVKVRAMPIDRFCIPTLPWRRGRFRSLHLFMQIPMQIFANTSGAS